MGDEQGNRPRLITNQFPRGEYPHDPTVGSLRSYHARAARASFQWSQWYAGSKSATTAVLSIAAIAVPKAGLNPTFTVQAVQDTLCLA